MKRSDVVKETKLVTVLHIAVLAHDGAGRRIVDKRGQQRYRVDLITVEYPGRTLNGIMPYDPRHNVRWQGPRSKHVLEVWEEEYRGEMKLHFCLPPTKRDLDRKNGQPRKVGADE